MTNKKLKDVITHIVPFTESNIAHHLEPVIKELVEVHFSDCLIYAVIDYVVRLDFETQGLSLRDWREDSFDWSRNMTNTPVAKHLVATLARDHAPHFVEYCDEFYPFLGLASPEASIYQTLRNMQGFGLTSGLYLESTEYGRDSITVFSNKLLECEEGQKALRQIFAKYINSRAESFEHVIFSTLKASVVDKWSHYCIDYLIVTLPDGQEMSYESYLDYLASHRAEI